MSTSGVLPVSFAVVVIIANIHASIDTITDIHILGTESSNTPCLITEHFEWSLDRVWTEYNESDGIPSYKTSFGLFDHPEVYMYRNSESMQWSIGSFIGSKWYYCSERDITDCTAGKWMYFDGEWKQDTDAAVHFGDGDECPSVTMYPTTEPQKTTEIQSTPISNESLSIQCGETLSGTVGDSPDSVLLHFVNLENQDVTFTDCDSEFDPMLFLIDSNGQKIQNQSTDRWGSPCDGNDCEDQRFCSVSDRETITMESFIAGSYTLILTPVNTGGYWKVDMICSEPTEC